MAGKSKKERPTATRLLAARCARAGTTTVGGWCPSPLEGILRAFQGAAAGMGARPPGSLRLRGSRQGTVRSAPLSLFSLATERVTGLPEARDRNARGSRAVEEGAGASLVSSPAALDLPHTLVEWVTMLVVTRGNAHPAAWARL